MSMNWADECDLSLRDPEFEEFLALQTEADRLFADIVEEEDKFSLSRVWLPLHSTEDDIYYQLLCAQIAQGEAVDIARATIFDAAQICGQTSLPEPPTEVLEFFVPKDIANYAAPTTIDKPVPPQYTRPRPRRAPTPKIQKMGPDDWGEHDILALLETTVNDSNMNLVGQPTRVRPQNRQLPSRSCYGVDPFALSVASDYMHHYGNAARNITQFVALERHIHDNMLWQRIQVDTYPPTNKIIFAIAHGLKLLRVRGGRTLEWNRFRDNHGNKLR